MDDDYDDSQVEGGRGVGGDLIDSEHTHTLELGSHNLGVVYSYFQIILPPSNLLTYVSTKVRLYVVLLSSLRGAHISLC